MSSQLATYSLYSKDYSNKGIGEISPALLIEPGYDYVFTVKR